MVEENISQEFRLKIIDKTGDYFLEEIEQNKLMRRSVQPLNYVKHILIIASTITECISISIFPSLLGMPIGITSSAIGWKICAIPAGIKKNSSIIKKKKRKPAKLVLIAKSKYRIKY